MVNVYVPFVHLNNYLFDVFGSFEYMHSSTVFIKTLLKETFTNKQPLVFINVEKNFFQIIVLKNKKIELFNSFNYNTKEDFIYYILFAIEQLFLNTQKIQLIFSGTIDKNSELYNITSEYIKTIDFYVPNYTIPEDLNLNNHSYFTLLNQF